MAITFGLLTGCTNSLPLLRETTVLNQNWKETKAPYSGNVVCTLKTSATAVFEGNHISTEAKIDKEPITITIVDIDSATPAFVGNLGDRVELKKIDLGSEIYLAEYTPSGNLNIWTLFRDKNILIGTKQYDLLGTPFGLLMMGDCLSGV